MNRFRRRLVQRRTLVVEDLDVRSLTASTRGTAAGPGRQVAAKAGLNRSILAQAFGEFRRQLAYTCAWTGARLIAVPPAYTSQRCARCGHVAAENRTAQAVFACVACGHRDHADRNAALDILAAGTAAAAQGAAA